MDNRTFGEVINALSRTASDFELLNNHFEQFCTQALRLNEPASPIKSIRVKREGKALLLAFLDRRLTVNFRLNRETRFGILHVEDVSAPERTVNGVHRTVTRIQFDSSGETGLPGGYTGDPINLGLVQDCTPLAVRIVDLAMNQDPWK
jgi:hypothetical protein